MSETIPRTMTAVEITEGGGPEVLKTTTRPVPEPRDGEVLVRVAAAGVNGPDIMSHRATIRPAHLFPRGPCRF